MDKKLEIGAKLKEFGEKNFKSIAEFSRKLGMNNPQQLYDYFNGKSYIGGELLSKLVELKCNVNWLLGSSGETPGVGNINEPTGSYMNYSDLLLENKKLAEEIRELKVELYDALKENRVLKGRNLHYKEENEKLTNEIRSLNGFDKLE